VAQKVRNLLRGPKDSALAFTARTFVNNRFQEIGQLTDLSVDTKTQTLKLRLSLSGEVEPVEIYVRKYRIRRGGDRSLLTIIDATASRRWLDAALREFVLGRSFAIPQGAGTALKLLT
jgi:hypothetical protein